MAKISLNITDSEKELWQKLARENNSTLTDYLKQSIAIGISYKDLNDRTCITDLIHDKYCDDILNELSKYFSMEYISTSLFNLNQEQKEQIIALGKLTVYKATLHKMYRQTILNILVKPEDINYELIDYVKEHGTEIKPIYKAHGKFKEENKLHSDYDRAVLAKKWDELAAIYNKHSEALKYYNWLQAFSTHPVLQLD